MASTRFTRYLEALVGPVEAIDSAVQAVLALEGGTPQESGHGGSDMDYETTDGRGTGGRTDRNGRGGETRRTTATTEGTRTDARRENTNRSNGVVAAACGLQDRLVAVFERYGV